MADIPPLGTEADEVIQGSARPDQLYGFGGNDVIDGGAGDDQIDGGSGADRMTGGSGNDFFVVDSAGDIVVEAAAGGFDGVEASIDYTLPANVEELDLDPGVIHGTGNALDNTFYGSPDDNVLNGLDGDDTFYGLGGDDSLDGGAGQDVAGYWGAAENYQIIRHGDGSVTVTDTVSDDGTDTLSNVETIAFGDGGTIAVAGLPMTGMAGPDVFRGWAAQTGDLGGIASFDPAEDRIDLSMFDAVAATPGKQGFAFIGTAAFGGTAGQLRYAISGGDVLVQADTDGDRVADLYFRVTGVTTLSAAAFLLGATANDHTGDDTYTFADGFGSATINDPGGNDQIVFQGSLSSTLAQYRADGHDLTIRFAGRPEQLVVTGYFGADGSPTIESIAFADGIAPTARQIRDAAFAALATAGNDTITGFDQPTTIVGLAGNDQLHGGSGSDTISGGAGDDLLDGGAGNDAMSGGLGNDIYLVTESGDSVAESYQQGIDEVRTTLASYTLGTDVENLTGLSDAGQTLTGNSLSNVLTGGRGADTLNGAAGSDTASYAWATAALLIDLQTGERSGDPAIDTLISIENLAGGRGDDTLRGTSAVNLLDGGAGADVLVGRGGSDVYLVDNVGDVVVEAAGQGTDEVRTTLASYTLGSEVESLTFVGTGAVVGTGNELNNLLIGAAGDDVLSGGAGYDSLWGFAGADTLYGGSEADVLDGGAGADRMEGGDGDDMFKVDNAGDLVVELAGGGIDLVDVSLASYQLPEQVENLRFNGSVVMLPFHGIGNALDNQLTGASLGDVLEGLGGNDTLTGNAGNDTLDGGNGDDLLVGGSGADVLTGGGGADLFRFAAFDSGTGGAADRITDFTQGLDRIDLSAVDTNYLVAGDQAFIFIGTSAFSGVSGELRYTVQGGDTWIEGDTNGDGVADYAIVLTGTFAPVASDFVL
jgi:Ca2+-binding RTX toxin-like protein